MNAAESLIATARAADIDACFANPGTSETPLVRALERTHTEPRPHLIEAVLA